MKLVKNEVLAGRYRLDRPLGKGGMGQVWVARHLQLDTEVAVKLMSERHVEHPEMRARFEREAKAAALLKSSHVVQVFDYGVEGGTPFIVMELLEGEDLQARLKRERQLSPAATAKIVVQLCKALRRAHEAGLVHRDLKPANVFIARLGDEEVVKILDFGIVKATGTTLPGLRTNGHLLMGSPQYMAPEQVFDSMAVDHRADLWSLAVMAFRCLTGKLPFDSTRLVDLLGEIREACIPRASALAPGLHPDVDGFFERALAREPAARFQSAAEFVEVFVGLTWSVPIAAADLTPTPGPIAVSVEDEQDALTIARPGSTPSLPAAAISPSGGTVMMSAAPRSEPGAADAPLLDLASSPATEILANSGSVGPIVVGDPRRASHRTRHLATAAAAFAALALIGAGVSVQRAGAPAGRPPPLDAGSATPSPVLTTPKPEITATPQVPVPPTPTGSAQQPGAGPSASAPPRRPPARSKVEPVSIPSEYEDDPHNDDDPYPE